MEQLLPQLTEDSHMIDKYSYAKSTRMTPTKSAKGAERGGKEEKESEGSWKENEK